MPPGYVTYRKDRSDGYGGVLVAVKDTLISSEVDIETKSELIAVQIEGEGKLPLIVASLYRQPNRNIEHMNTLCSDIHNLYEKFKSSTIWIAGDANLPDIDWKTDSIQGNNYPKEFSEQFIDLKTTCGFSQVVDFTTREDKTLEVFLTNRPSLINRVTPIPGISDHDTIPYIESSIKAKYQRPVRRKIFLWKKAKMEDLKPGMERFVTHFIEHHTIDTGINTLWSEFESKCAALMNEHIPSKFTSTRYSQPWVNNEIKQLSRRKKRSYKKAKKTGKQKDWRRFNDIKKEAQRLCKETYNSYVSNMKMITPTILNDFGASLRVKEQRVQEWRLYGKKEYFTATVTPKQTF